VIAGLLGLTLVTRAGTRIGRGRALLRLAIAFSPLLVWGVWLGWPPFQTISQRPIPSTWFLAIALVLMAIGGVWTIVRRVRGPHDVIAGTWMVPK
jgi:hypothetical protein